MSSSVTVSSLLGNIQDYAFNPATIQRSAIAAFDAINDGTIQIVDGTNPFVFCLENTSVNVAAFMQQNTALTRRLYPAAATTVDDLYLHMADTDYVNIFALPSLASFTLMINEKQLLNALVTDPITGISQVTIPRNTVFNAAGIKFSIQYPINIRKLMHGGLQIVYDTSVVSPLQNLSTNIIDFSTVNDPNGVSYVVFSVDTQQFNIISLEATVSNSGGFTTSVAFNNQFYYCRVYSTNNAGKWVEMAITYTQEVYSPNTPTAVVSVSNGVAVVTIPIIYVTTNQVFGKVRIDVYETMGPMNLMLGNYSPNNFSADFMYVDKNDSTVYTSAFTSISSIVTYSQDTTTGGRNALTFEELQTRVINNSIGPKNIPITPSQIQTSILDLGYSLVKYADTVTDRVYWATKSLPAPTSPNLVTTANASVVSLITNIASADTLQGVTSHSLGMTVTSAAIVKTINGISSLVTKNQYTALISQTLPELCASINAGSYSYSPFYYVLESTVNTFEVRPYYLDTPSIKFRSFIQENPATGTQVSIASTYSITKTSTGYRLVITTISNAAYQALPDNEVFCQISYTTNSVPAFMLGIQQPRNNNAGERAFVFDITTAYEIDSNDQIALTSFISNSPVKPKCDLNANIAVTFSSNSTTLNTAPATEIDNYLGTFQLPSGTIGITHENLNIQFGYALATLWNSYRSIVAPVPYQTYLSDEQDTYSKDVYLNDPLTNNPFTTNTAGDLVFTKLHSAGDLVFDSNNNPIYKHRAGDPIIDVATGLPKPVLNYNTIVNRLFDMVVIDSVYQFANDPITLEYVGQINRALITSLTSDLASLSQKVLEKTKIYYYPEVSKGNVNVIIDNNQVMNIEAAQKLQVVLYVAPDVYKNINLTNNLESITIKTIGKYLHSNTTVSVSHLKDALSVAYGSDILGISLSGFGGEANYSVITIMDNSSTLSISKILTVLPNNTLAVKEDISIIFKVHTASNI